jgi:hypothetical protein
MLMIAAAVAACGGSGKAPPPPVVHHIGEPVQAGSLVLTVNSVSYPPATAYDTPDPGKKFLGVNVTIQNKAPENQVIFSRDVMFVADSQGRKYVEDQTATMVAGPAPPDGDPYPGKDLSGTAGYQIADDATGLRLIFDTTVMKQKFLVGGPRGDEIVVALQ